MTRVLIAGGGLAGSLVAWRLRQARPELQVDVVERGERLGGNHTWSFHETDLARAERGLLAPLVARSWPCYDVRFPVRERRLEGAYHSITSERLHEVIAKSLGGSLRLGASVRALDEDGRDARRRDVAPGRPRARRTGPRRATALRVGLSEVPRPVRHARGRSRARRPDADGRHRGAARRLPLPLRAALVESHGS